MADNTNYSTRILAKAIADHLAAHGGSYHDIAAGSGISPSSVCRIMNLEGAPDMDTIIGLCGFLKLSVGRVLNTGDAIVYYPQQPLPEIVRELLAADENLLPGGAEILSAVFQSAYQQSIALGNLPTGENTSEFKNINL